MDELAAAAYLDAVCAANGLALAGDERERILVHFLRAAEIVAPLQELELADDVEMAPVFKP
jgi:Protein of unknown function (DUF4089)